MRSRAARFAGPPPRAGTGADGYGNPFVSGPLPRVRAALRVPPPCGGGGWRSACAAGAVAWLPLLLLTAARGDALSPGAAPSFLRDVSAHALYLVTLPLLIAAEPWCLPQLAAIVRHFGAGGVVAGRDRARWAALVASTRRMLDHRGVEVALVLAAYGAALLLGLRPRGGAAWAAPDGHLSPAGWWRTLVSQPLFLLGVGAWVWRVVAWARLLWGVSRLRLRLVAPHPDGAAGLRFVAVSLRAFAPVALALGASVAGTLAGETLAAAAPAQEFSHAGTVILTVLIVLAQFAGPLLAFTGPLHRARLRGIMEYGTLAGALGRRFEHRWLPRAAGRRDALHAPDFSATADLYAIASAAHSVAVVPVGLGDLLVLVAATLLPFVPLVFLEMPLDAVLKRIAGVLL